jgi:hypothetical protein
MLKKQSGFAVIEGLLILIIIAILGFTSWYVWHARSQADKTLNDTLNSGQSVPNHSSKKKADTAGQDNKTGVAAPRLVNYATTPNSTGVEISSASDIDKLDGASDSFKDFIKGKINKNSNSPSPCGNAYGIFVKKIYKDEFALGGEGQCGGAEKLWAKISDEWQEIGATQQGFDCSLLEKYNVPSAIIENCIKNGQEIKNTIK